MAIVGQFSHAEIVRLIRFYEKAERELLNRVNRALLRGNSIEYLKQMKQAVDAILQSLREGNKTWCLEAIPRVYLDGVRYADGLLKEARVEITTSFGAVHQSAAQVLAENVYQRLEDVTQVIGRQVNDIYRQLALENVRGSTIGYDTWKQVAQQIRQQIAERGITGFVDRQGKRWNLSSYTAMVARTSTMEAHLEGTRNRLLEQGHDLVVISDHRGECELCRPWEGRVLSLSGRTPHYPTLEEAKAAGLFHPNCRHTYGLYIDLDKEIEELERELDLTPEEEENYLEIEGLSKPAKTSLAKALTEALEHGLKTGTECLLHIDKNTGKSVFSKIGGTINEVVFPRSLIDFLDNAAPNSIIQVHNHPRSSSFSVDDIGNLAVRDSINTISVIGHDGTKYVLSIGSGQRVDWVTLQKEYNTFKKKHFDFFNNQVISEKMTEKQAWKEHSHRIVMDLADKYGWEYRRVMPNEK